MIFFFFFFNDTATTEIYTLSLHDALPISPQSGGPASPRGDYQLAQIDKDLVQAELLKLIAGMVNRDRKSTRLNSSHGYISYAVFCLKKKNTGHFNATSRRDTVVAAHPRGR